LTFVTFLWSFYVFLKYVALFMSFHLQPDVMKKATKTGESLLLLKVDGKSIYCRSLQKHIAMLSLRLSTREGIHIGAMEVKLHAFFTSALDGIEWSVSRPSHFSIPVVRRL
jgi:hypothetical protein